LINLGKIAQGMLHSLTTSRKKYVRYLQKETAHEIEDAWKSYESGLLCSDDPKSIKVIGFKVKNVISRFKKNFI
jgi:hypothetical protein